MESNKNLKLDELNLNYFPYTPYPSQVKFIESLTCTLMNKKAGIFESPTGTGKSLSLICGVLNFLDSLKITESKLEVIAKPDNNDWLNSFGKNEKESSNNHSKRKINQTVSVNCGKKIPHEIDCFSSQSLKQEDKMLIKNENVFLEKAPSKYNSTNDKKKIQIFYCTRTHSQISQIISEVKKIEKEFKIKTGEKLNFSCTSLGSRKLLCINKKVNNINTSISKLNEKCLDLIQSSSTKCQFYNSDSIESFTKEISRKIYDIEELYKLGENISTCPYYSSRKSLDNSDMIVIPYNCILNNKIRKSLDIDLENKILIFDEAHNLVENILQTFNAEISLDELVLILFGINLYYSKYCNRLKSSSNMYLRQLTKITEGFVNFLINFEKNKKNSVVVNLAEFLIDLELTNLNLFTILNFIDIAELHNKIKWTLEYFIKENFCFGSNNIQQESNSEDKKQSHMKEMIEKYFPIKIFPQQSQNFVNKFSDKNINTILNKYPDMMQNFSEFLNGLTYLTQDGKILIEKSSSNSIIMENIQSFSLKYIMINASREFDNIIKMSKCVIFAGGTMRPIDEFQFLLRMLRQEDITYFEGSHVVNKENLLISNICQDTISNKLGKIILNHDQIKNKTEETLSFILQTVKAHYELMIGESKIEARGIVVFVSNYELVEKIKKLNEVCKILDVCSDNYVSLVTFKSVENIFFEEKNISDTFIKYQSNILVKKCDSVLFAVVGGKLSEGINFSDNLARVVLMFGLPYPNVTSTELKLKMAYYDDLKAKGECSISGAEYYSNICMKAVNQSVGRSIRHINDYAAIIFVDYRYSSDNIRKKLPRWITDTGIMSINNMSDYEIYKKNFRNFFLKFQMDK